MMAASSKPTHHVRREIVAKLSGESYIFKTSLSQSNTRGGAPYCCWQLGLFVPAAGRQVPKLDSVAWKGGVSTRSPHYMRCRLRPGLLHTSVVERRNVPPGATRVFCCRSEGGPRGSLLINTCWEISRCTGIGCRCSSARTT